MNLTIDLKPENLVIGKNLHILKGYIDEELIGQAILSLDEIEDLEGQLTDVMMQLSKYRRALQREDI